MAIQETATIQSYIKDPTGLILFGTINSGSLPTEAGLFQVGCTLTRVDVQGAGTKEEYSNQGTVAVPNWVLKGGGGGGLPALPDGQIFVGDATDEAVAVPLSGDVTIDNTGALTLEEEVRVITEKVTISSAEILNSGTTPVQLIAAPGVGKFIDVISVTIQKNFGTIAYSENVFNKIGFTGNGIVEIMVDFSQSELEKSSTDSGLVLPNEPLLFYNNGGDPENGDGTLEVYVTYKIVTL